MRSVEPTPERFRSFVEGADPLTPLIMINLLRYRETAQYPADFDAQPCTGREAYERYAEVATKHVAAVGGRVLWEGQVMASVIAPDAEEWDEVILVEYPSREAFVKMVSDPEYQAAVPDRTAALLDSRLLATQAAVWAARESNPRTSG